jgi:PTH1 family peptidyl-tRNA hydrolase
VFLVVGLGNPGREHENDRHNAGFMAVDALRRAEGWPDYAAKFGGLFTRGELGGVPGLPVALLQPQTYMNLSGDSVQPAAAFLKVPPQNLIVVHDELDLPWKDIRLKVGGGHAGHNGLRSLLERLGTPDFVRVRVGVGKPPPGFPGANANANANVTRDWVLSGFDPVERAELPDVLGRAVAAVRRIVSDGITPAMKAVNTRT